MATEAPDPAHPSAQAGMEPETEDAGTRDSDRQPRRRSDGDRGHTHHHLDSPAGKPSGEEENLKGSHPSLRGPLEVLAQYSRLEMIDLLPARPVQRSRARAPGHKSRRVAASKKLGWCDVFND